MFAEKNKEKKAKWDINTEGFQYYKLKEYLKEFNIPDDEVITVRGYYINDLQNGRAVTIITDDCMINMPSHALDFFEGLTEEENAAINAGKLGISNFREVVIKRFKQKTIYFDYLDL